MVRPIAAALLFLVSVVPLGCSSASVPAAAPARPPELFDYLVQDVCVDQRGAAVAGDPARCRMHRNLRVGEPVRYLMTDYDPKTGATLQASVSVPVRGHDGHVMVLLLKLLAGSFGPRSPVAFSPARDAYDLVDLSHSAYASTVRTFDGGCFDQLLSRSGRGTRIADRAGGWVLFPLSPPPGAWPREQSIRNTTWRRELSGKGGPCADNHATGVTRWTRPTPTSFEGGQRLEALRTDHFAAADLSQPENSFERSYFTREYGLTRWEAWQTLAYCQKKARSGDLKCRPDDPANPWHARCSRLREPGSGQRGIATYGGQTWVRIYCRDQSHYVALESPQQIDIRQIAHGRGVVDLAAPQ